VALKGDLLTLEDFGENLRCLICEVLLEAGRLSGETFSTSLTKAGNTQLYYLSQNKGMNNENKMLISNNRE